MSFAKDDVTAIKDLHQIPAGILLSKNVNGQKKADSISPEGKEESEKLVLSTKFEEKVKNKKEDLISLQEEKNLLETAQKGLDETRESLDKMKNTVEQSSGKDQTEESMRFTSKRVNDEIAKAEEKMKKTSFNGIMPLKDEEMLPEKVELKSPEDARQFLKSVDRHLESVQEKQMQLADREQEIITEVSSRIELEPANESIDYDITEEGKFEQVKSDVASEITASPKKSLKVQITSLSKNMILALLSV